VIEHIPQDKNKVFFGAQVSLEDEHGQDIIYRLVGSDEFDHKPHYISIDSPMARALLKKQIDDEVKLKLPDGEKLFWIMGIEYPSPHED